MINKQYVYLLSDATGETVEKIVDAALTQFPKGMVLLKRVGNVRTRERILNTLEEAAQKQGMVVYTIVNHEFALLIHEECEARGIPSIDLLTPLLMKLSGCMGLPPKEMPGLFHGINEKYFQRIEAVEFSVQHDDGQELRSLHFADIVLAGVSRTSKTPLSMYLAHSGWKVANVPIVMGVAPPKELFEVDPKKVVGLIIDPQHLVELRIARLKYLNQSIKSDYADYEQIVEEILYAKTLFRRNSWITVRVSGKAVEETANEILVKLSLK
jgi:regulator of PEP synthase PpsR (kinase-PPPase family)